MRKTGLSFAFAQLDAVAHIMQSTRCLLFCSFLLKGMKMEASGCDPEAGDKSVHKLTAADFHMTNVFC